MKIDDLLSGKCNNHIMPFLWVHGEEEAVYRNMIRVIDEANIGAFCVEARPHKQFCREKWWQDMDAILDEAQKRNMKVWILDDKHFPTGYANGAAEAAPAQLRRQSLFSRSFPVKGNIRLNLHKACHPRSAGNFLKKTLNCGFNLYLGNYAKHNRFDDDRFVSVTAIRKDQPTEPLNLKDFVREGVLNWQAPKGKWEVVLCGLSRNLGAHRGYINMMDKESCRMQIDAVYEPHYARYKHLFGTVIAGFFSDEPELGNNDIYRMDSIMGTQQDLPWSRALEDKLRSAFGEDFDRYLPLLWNNDCDTSLTARVRYTFMDHVTRLVEECFSLQIGTWCRDHGVEYIGHVIEDENQHARTGCSLGHYFRGLKGQSMAGIDDIGGQVYPGGEDSKKKHPLGFILDGEFYHYTLGKLGASLGALAPHMQGRTMCEIFGNYGWNEGLRLEKYLLDHFMVRGVNHFVPHAFSCKAYPDPDCPPHFYAQGNNPQYRHFGKLMQYTNRVCDLISGGKAETPVAILYHGEAEWTGKCMLMQKPARICQDNQIDFLFVPADVFVEPDFYKAEITNTLQVNGQDFQVLVLPYAQFITPETAEAICTLTQNDGKVLILDALPDGLTNGQPLPEAVRDLLVVPLDSLYEHLKPYRTVRLMPADNRIRAMHYRGEEELVYLVNEGDSSYTGAVRLPMKGEVCMYDPWNNRLETLKQQDNVIFVTLQPYHGMIVVAQGERRTEAPLAMRGCPKKMTSFTQSVCRSIDYPDFQKHRQIHTLESYHLTDPKFSGFIRYETKFTTENGFAGLEISDAYEGVEVFVNGKSAGIQILPPFRYDLTQLCKPGRNQLTIEVATTLEQERHGKNAAPTGITGTVTLYTGTSE